MRYLCCVAICLITILLLPISTNAQTRFGDLSLVKGRILQIKSDTLIIENLIMHDSSKLILTTTSKTSYLKLKKIAFGENCHILYSTPKGTDGRDGKEFETPSGPCKSGVPGQSGQNGSDGMYGNTLVLEINNVQTSGKKLLGIYLNGGDGGDGGDGGNGSHGYKGTKFCLSNGGDGGNGGNGGNGGTGGTLIVQGLIDSTVFKNTITVFVNGGYKGYGGRPGNGGVSGPGSSEKSKNGLRGREGLKGKNGLPGKIIFRAKISL